MMASFTRKLQQHPKTSVRDHYEKCSTKLPLFAYLFRRTATKSNNGEHNKGALCLGSASSKPLEASHNNSVKVDALVKRDKCRQPWNSYDCRFPAECSLSACDNFDSSSMEMGNKPIRLPRHLPFRSYRAAISEMKKCLATSNTDEIMSVFSASSQKMKGFPTSICVKILPRSYNLAEPFDLIGLISDAVIDLMDKRTPLTPGRRNLTRFHSKLAPHISVYDYIDRFFQLGHLSSPTLLTTLIYIRKLLCLQPDFFLSVVTVHRLLLSCIIVSVKVHNDFQCSKRMYAQAGGVRPEELTILELELLKLLSWDVIPRKDHLEDCYLGLVDRNGGYILLEPEYVP